MRLLARCAGFVGILLLASVASSRSAEPTVDDLLRLTRELENVGNVRVSTVGQVVTLAGPRVEPGGLAFEKVEPPPRTALFRTPRSIEPAPTNPIAWEQIERVDAEVSHRTRNMVLGALAGWLVGSVVGIATNEARYTDEFPHASGKAILIGIGSGVMFGVLVTNPSWRQVYPATEER